jgi:hypothetical protein
MGLLKKKEKKDALVVVKEFLRDMKAGRVTKADAKKIGAELLILQARMEKVQAMYPDAGLGLGEDVETLIKLVGKQTSVHSLRPKGIRRAASLL